MRQPAVSTMHNMRDASLAVREARAHLSPPTVVWPAIKGILQLAYPGLLRKMHEVRVQVVVVSVTLVDPRQTQAGATAARSEKAIFAHCSR